MRVILLFGSLIRCFMARLMRREVGEDGETSDFHGPQRPISFVQTQEKFNTRHERMYYDGVRIEDDIPHVNFDIVKTKSIHKHERKPHVRIRQTAHHRGTTRHHLKQVDWTPAMIEKIAIAPLADTTKSKMTEGERRDRIEHTASSFIEKSSSETKKYSSLDADSAAERRALRRTARRRFPPETRLKRITTTGVQHTGPSYVMDSGSHPVENSESSPIAKSASPPDPLSTNLQGSGSYLISTRIGTGPGPRDLEGTSEDLDRDGAPETIDVVSSPSSTLQMSASSTARESNTRSFASEVNQMSESRQSQMQYQSQQRRIQQESQQRQLRATSQGRQSQVRSKVQKNPLESKQQFYTDADYDIARMRALSAERNGNTQQGRSVLPLGGNANMRWNPEIVRNSNRDGSTNNHGIAHGNNGNDNAKSRNDIMGNSIYQSSLVQANGDDIEPMKLMVPEPATVSGDSELKDLMDRTADEEEQELNRPDSPQLNTDDARQASSTAESFTEHFKESGSSSDPTSDVEAAARMLRRIVGERAAASQLEIPFESKQLLLDTPISFIQEGMETGISRENHESKKNHDSKENHKGKKATAKEQNIGASAKEQDMEIAPTSFIQKPVQGHTMDAVHETAAQLSELQSSLPKAVDKVLTAIHTNRELVHTLADFDRELHIQGLAKSMLEKHWEALSQAEERDLLSRVGDITVTGQDNLPKDLPESTYGLKIQVPEDIDRKAIWNYPISNLNELAAEEKERNYPYPTSYAKASDYDPENKISRSSATQDSGRLGAEQYYGTGNLLDEDKKPLDSNINLYTGPI